MRGRQDWVVSTESGASMLPSERYKGLFRTGPQLSPGAGMGAGFVQVTPPSEVVMVQLFHSGMVRPTLKISRAPPGMGINTGFQWATSATLASFTGFSQTPSTRRER